MITENTDLNEIERQIITAPTSLDVIMNELRGVTFVGFDTLTTPTVNKFYVDENGDKQPNPHHGRITKLTEGARGLVYQNKNVSGYKNQVEKQMKAEGIEGEFKPGPRKWGVRHESKPIVTHNGKTYLEIIFQNSGTTTYLLDGQPIDKSDVIGLRVSKSYGGQGGVEKQIIIRTVEVPNIQELRIYGKAYQQITG